jgi:hypothetical protein
MKRILYTLCLMLPFQVSILLSQNTAGQLIREVNTIMARNKVGNLTYDDITGSPYYSAGFINSTIHFQNGNVAELPLRYDLYQDEIEFQRSGTILWVIKTDVVSIRYGTETLIPEPVPDEPGKYTYYFVPESGHYSLYVKKKVDFSPHVPPKAYTEALPDRFEHLQDEYYLKQEGSPPVIMRSKKSLSEFLKDNEPALEFVKKSKIRASDPEDLRELVKFLNNQ